MHSIPALKHQTPTWACSRDASKKRNVLERSLHIFSRFFALTFLKPKKHIWSILNVRADKHAAAKRSARRARLLAAWILFSELHFVM